MSTLLPKLRRQDWHRAKEAWVRPLVTNIPSTEIPLVSHVYDMGDRTGTILNESLKEETRTPAELEAEAIRNLEARPIKWRTQTIGNGIIALCGDEYAPELILSPTRMAEAGALVGDTGLAVSIPSDQLIVVGSAFLDQALKGNVVQSMMQQGTTMFEKYKAEGQHLSTEIFLVMEGKPAGIIARQSSLPATANPAAVASLDRSPGDVAPTGASSKTRGLVVAVIGVGLLGWGLAGTVNVLAVAAGGLALLGGFVMLRQAK